jgi:sulfur relay (sulfurtransferase) complex TusBCD TusD component (DsrE family)
VSAPAPTPLRGRQLAVVLGRAGDLSRAAALCHAARSAGVEVAVFAMADAVGDLAAAPAALAALLDDGVEVVACAHSAQLRGLCEADLGVTLGSQDDHAAIVHRADRVVAFT